MNAVSPQDSFNTQTTALPKFKKGQMVCGREVMGRLDEVFYGQVVGTGINRKGEMQYSVDLYRLMSIRGSTLMLDHQIKTLDGASVDGTPAQIKNLVLEKNLVTHNMDTQAQFAALTQFPRFTLETSAPAAPTA